MTDPPDQHGGQLSRWNFRDAEDDSRPLTSVDPAGRFPASADRREHLHDINRFTKNAGEPVET